MKDNFKFDEDTTQDMIYPCYTCVHRHGTDSDEPCATCMHNSNAKKQMECDEKHILDKIVVNRRTAAIIAAHLADEIGETCCAKLLGIGIVEFRELEYDLQLEGIAAWDEYRKLYPPECNNINQKAIA